MNIRIYDQKQIEKTGNIWYIGAGNLYEYLVSLRSDFFDYKIQRRLVANKYLDSLYKTIEQGEPIPAVTLITDKPLTASEGKAVVDMKSMDILDGLQRTYRLWVIFKLGHLADELSEKSFDGILSYIKQHEPELLELDFVNIRFLRLMAEPRNTGIYLDYLIGKMKEFDLTFTIWSGLSEDDIVKKMLILNAGQKPVSVTHQSEIIFMRFFNKNELNLLNGKIRLYREKDSEYSRIRKGLRKVGEYVMSSVVIALLSYISKRPMRVSLDKIVRWDSENFFDSEMTGVFFNSRYLSNFLIRLYDIDEVLSARSDAMKVWIGKDTTLSGLYAALGECMVEIDSISSKLRLIDFRLDEFESEYGRLSSVRINVGNEVRKAIYRYTQAGLRRQPIQWSVAFGNDKDDYAKAEPLF